MSERWRRLLPSRKTLSVILTVVSVLLTLYCTVELIERLTTAKADVYASLAEVLSLRWLLLTEILLFVVNISLEALKWWLVNGRNYERYSWWRVYVTVLVAIAFGGVTPGRVGEHVARMQDGAGKSDALVGSLVSSIVQTMVIVVFALVGSYLYIGGCISDISDDRTFFIVTIFVVLILLVVVSFLFRYALLRWRNNEYIQRFTMRRLGSIFAVNALRYVVFATQLVLILVYDDMSLFVDVFIVATIYYLTITLLPTINIVDIGVKNEMAVIVFGSLLTEPRIFTAVFVVWLLNTCLPSLFGLMVNIGLMVRRIVVR